MRLEYSFLLLLFLARGSLVCFSRLSLSVLSIVKISGTFCLASLTQTTFLKYFGHFCFTSQQNYSLVFVNLSSPLDCELFRVHKHVLLSFLSIYFLPQKFSSVQFSSVTQSCPTPCDPMNRSTPGLAVRHQLPEFIQTHVHQVGDAIQPSHPLSSPSPAPNPSQHQSLLQ